MTSIFCQRADYMFVEGRICRFAKYKDTPAVRVLNAKLELEYIFTLFILSSSNSNFHSTIHFQHEGHSYSNLFLFTHHGQPAYEALDLRRRSTCLQLRAKLSMQRCQWLGRLCDKYWTCCLWRSNTKSNHPTVSVPECCFRDVW
jgi:hypothetical protein